MSSKRPGRREFLKGGADAVQQILITGSPTGGTFRLLFGGQTSVSIAYNATAPTVQSALQGLSSIGANNALVSGPAGGRLPPPPNC